MRTTKLHFGKMEKFSVIQKEKYFNVCIWCEKKKIMGESLRFQIIIYDTLLFIYGGSEKS